jgi:CheY-like chemotaxis protein
VFEPFVQTESGIRKQTGTGLGVSISRDFARLLGGDLTVQSTPGTGTTFCLQLRVAVGARAELIESPAADWRRVDTADGRRLTILIVDDQEDNRTFLREVLLSAGINVYEVADGASAVARFVELTPDLIFMDVKMPGMDGVEATLRIRQLPQGKHVPIVMLSASVFDEERDAVLQTGGNQFIAKPFQVADIWNALERHLGVGLVSDAGPALSKREGPALTRQQVAALGEQAVTAVREAIALGYVQRIPALLAGVGTEHAVTVAALSRLAEDLELEKLSQLL